MNRRPRWLSLASIGISGALVASMSVPGLAQSPSADPSMAASPARSPAASMAASPAGSAAASVAATPYPDPLEQPPAPTADLTEYPNYGGEVDCDAGTFNGRPYSGNLKKMSAPDPQTVVFEFCNPNVAFIAQVSFSSLAIDDAQYLIDHMADGSILSEPNGTGPYRLEEWDRGNRLVLTANDAYWGTKALTPTVEFRWSNESAQRLTELLGGTVDGIDNPGKDDMPTIEGTDGLTLYPREGTNTMYLGMNNRFEPWDDVKVRQAIAMGIDRDRIVTNFYPPGSSVASHFTPCLVPFACTGDEWHAFDPEAARALLAEAGFPDGFSTKIQLRDIDRSYIQAQTVVAQEIQAQLAQNLNVQTEIEVQESQTFLDNNAAGLLDGLFILGWGMDYPDVTNFLDYHFGIGSGDKFGDPHPEIVDVLNRAGRTPVDEERETLYAEANHLIREFVPAVIVAHSGSATAFKTDVAEAHSSPLSTEIFAVVKPADRDALVWMQSAEPNSFYCGDEVDGESLRACEQVKESLYGYEVGGLASVPSLATECAPNDDLTVWTCALRGDVTFHDSSPLDASDVILSYAAQWDAISPLHVGRTGAFEYWPALVGAGYLNRAGPCGLPNTAACP